MTIAVQFITDLQREQRIGNVSSETEQHLKHEFRKLGRDASGPILAVTVEAEILRLERRAATLWGSVLDCWEGDDGWATVMESPPGTGAGITGAW